MSAGNVATETESSLVLTPPAPKHDVSEWMLAAGYVLAFLIPLIGFVLGIIVTVRRAVAHGVAMMVIAVVVTVALTTWMVEGGGRDATGP